MEIILILIIIVVVYLILKNGTSKNKNNTNSDVKSNQYNDLHSEKAILLDIDTECENLKTNDFLEENKTKIQCNYIEEYINQFSGFDFDKEIMFIYYEYKKNGYAVTNTITQYAKRKSKLKNLFSKDTSEIHVCVFDKSDYDYIGIFKEFINKNFVKNTLMINGIDIYEYKEYFNEYRKDNSGKFENIEKSLKFIRKEINVSSDEMKKIIYLIFDNWYKSYSKTIEYNMHLLNTSMYKEIVARILDTFFKNEMLDVKWKNEYRLYTIAHKFFRDSIYQYRPEWLTPQSFDVFIPSLNVAIEYQGIQHYQAVEIFGGEKGLENNKRRDEKKRSLCLEQNVILIEWNYQQEVNEFNFLEKIKSITGESVCSDIQSSNEEYVYNIKKYYDLNYIFEDYREDILNKAMSEKNLEIIYMYFKYYIKNRNYKNIENIWCTLITQNTRWSMQNLIMQIVKRNIFVDEFISIIVHSNTLLEYYMRSKDFNYITRRIVIGMIQEHLDNFSVEYFMEIKKESYKKCNKSGWNTFLKSLLDEVNEDDQNVAKLLVQKFSD